MYETSFESWKDVPLLLAIAVVGIIVVVNEHTAPVLAQVRHMLEASACRLKNQLGIHFRPFSVREGKSQLALTVGVVSLIMLAVGMLFQHFFLTSLAWGLLWLGVILLASCCRWRDVKAVAKLVMAALMRYRFKLSG